MPGAALLGLVLCRHERRAIATKAASIATLTLIVATLDAHHWMGSFAPDIDVLLALYVVMVALLIGLGISALELDLRQSGFGWRQACAGLVIAAIAVATLPFLTNFASGRFDLPTSSVAESLSALAPSQAGGYRVSGWGTPGLPIQGWSVAPDSRPRPRPTDCRRATRSSRRRAPARPTRCSRRCSWRSRVAPSSSGSCCRRRGIWTIVVMDASAPELAGVQSVPLRGVPTSLTTALSLQTDLSLVLQTDSVEVYSNSMFHGLVSETTPGSTTPTPVFAATSNSGAISSNAKVVAGLAPASAFELEVNGRAAPRTVSSGWAPTYKVGTLATGATAKLVLHRFPLNGLLALVTLLLWTLVWLGFGVIARLEWLFTGRRQATVARDARRERHG